MPHETWRERFQRNIQAAIEEAGRRGLAGKELLRFVRESSSPGLSCGHYPLRMWREEVRYLLRGKRRPERGPSRRVEPAPGQGELF